MKCTPLLGRINLIVFLVNKCMGNKRYFHVFLSFEKTFKVHAYKIIPFDAQLIVWNICILLILQGGKHLDQKHTFPFNPMNSGELIIASAGARNTKDGPCIKGNLDPKDVCRSVVIPDTKSTVETTFEVSSYTH